MKYHLDRITFGASEIEYRIYRTSRRKTVAITVSPDASVTVAAPKGARRARIAEAVLDKAKWILKHRDWFARNSRRMPRRLVSGESLFYLGRQCQLKVFLLAGREVSPKVALTHGTLIVMIPRRRGESRRHAAVKHALVEWYRVHAEAYLAPLIQRYADRLAVRYASIQVRDMRTRWGSGGTSGRLRFNWRLMMAPRRLIEYVVAHELCHIRSSGHSRKFWRLLGRVMPDYERRRAELESSGTKYDV